MQDITEVIERAMLLNMTNCYLDEDKCIYLRGSDVEFKLDRYIELLDENMNIIEIPEGITHVKILGSNLYKGTGYVFKFPSTLLSVYTLHNPSLKNAINMSLCYCYANFLDCLRNSTLDFSNCNKIIRISRNSFASYSIKELLFSASVQEIGSHAFDSSDIRILSLPIVKKLGSDAFVHANVKHLKVSNETNLNVDSGPDEIKELYLGRAIKNGKIKLSYTKKFKGLLNLK